MCSDPGEVQDGRNKIHHCAKGVDYRTRLDLGERIELRVSNDEWDSDATLRCVHFVKTTGSSGSLCPKVAIPHETVGLANVVEIVVVVVVHDSHKLWSEEGERFVAATMDNGKWIDLFKGNYFRRVSIASWGE